MEQASCRACVDSCPAQAWVMDDERLGIDTGRCDGCGLCAPACPEGAIEGHPLPGHYRVEGLGIAFAACTRAGIPPGDWGSGLLPCLHCLGEGALLELHRRGVRRLVLCSGDCDTCPRGTVRRVEAHLAGVNALLRDRRRDTLILEPEDGLRWVRRLRAARARHQSHTMGRRALFRGLLSAAVERAEAAEPGFLPPGRLVATGDARAGGLSLHAPRIDGDRCSGCDACARLCPHGVIRVEADAYHLAPEGCTGCGLCSDLCPAVSVSRLDPSPQRRLALHQRRCAACGSPFHTPSPPSGAKDRCPICARTGHRERLYQVLP